MKEHICPLCLTTFAPWTKRKQIWCSTVCRQRGTLRAWREKYHIPKKPSGGRKKRPVAERLWERIDQKEPNECWPWRGHTDGSYGEIGSGGRGGRRLKAHRLVWELTHGSVPRKLFVLHRCDNRICCNPKHLFLGTQKDNIHDMMRKGRQRFYQFTPHRGQQASNAKLKDSDIPLIRRALLDGVPQKVLVARWHIDQSTISRIGSRKRWCHVPD